VSIIPAISIDLNRDYVLVLRYYYLLS
jgi:hypothetical protein